MTNDSHVNEHLANERTFLAWTRTSLSLIGIGFVVARFGLTLSQLLTLQGRIPTGHTTSIDFGAVLMSVGVLLEAMATYRYHDTRARISSGDFKPATWTILAVGVITTVAGIGLAADMLLFHHSF